jgi:hypothetical protein
VDELPGFSGSRILGFSCRIFLSKSRHPRLKPCCSTVITRGKGLFVLSLFTGNTGSNCETFIIENLVNELDFLDKGFSVTINKTVYIIQARLIMHCYDSRASESVVKVQGAGSYAGCPLCGLCEG